MGTQSPSIELLFLYSRKDKIRGTNEVSGSRFVWNKNLFECKKYVDIVTWK